MELKYRICWKSKTTGTEGHGEFVYKADEKQLAERIAEKYNRENQGFEHWVEGDETESSHTNLETLSVNLAGRRDQA